MLALLGLEWDDSLGLSDILVGGGTLALAVFTYRLGRVTVALDERTAARERKRREREVRGAARLIYGEMDITQASLSAASERLQWTALYLTPHGAWDRDGALIVETMAQDEAAALIDFFSSLREWELMSSGSEQTHFQFIHLAGQEAESLATLVGLLKDARRHLQNLAYPDARELEPDPDSFLAWRRERRAERRARVGRWVQHPWRSVRRR